jgi:hypothetical protein
VKTNYNGLKISMNNFIESSLNGYTIVFDENFADPETFESGARWVVPVYGDFYPSTTVKSNEFFLYCFCKGDPEGLELSEMIDTICGVFSDPAQNDGNKRIPLNVVKDGNLSQESTIIASDIIIEGTFRLGDSTLGQTIRINLLWC